MQPVTNSGVGAVPPGPALVYMPAPMKPRTYERYNHKQSIGLGITQIIISILCVIFNSVCIGVSTSYGNGFGFVGHGYWCGIMFLITGIFGVVAGKKKTRCQIVSFMVLCIISATFTIGLLAVGIFGAIYTSFDKCYEEVDYRYNYNYGYYTDDYTYYPHYRWVCYNVPYYKVIIAMESLLAICGLVEVIVAIWGSTLGCRAGVCCCSTTSMAMPAPGYFPNSGQMICISQTQGGPYVYAPQPTFAYPQGLVAPPAYAQPTWTNIGPVFGQAPPAYATNQVQPLWMIQPATANPGPLAAGEAQSTDMAPNETKERV